MARHRLSRRTFIAATTAAGMGLLVGCGSSAPISPPVVGATVMYRRSTRGIRASQAARAHAANRLYRTLDAAAADPAHPGDRARVVPLDVSRKRWLELFGGGAEVFDYRWV